MERVEGITAAFVELAEELHKLKTRRVDEAAEGVDGKVPVLMADGKVISISSNVTDDEIAALLTRAGSEVIDATEFDH